MAIRKPDGSVRPVINFSAPEGKSVNDGIEKKEVTDYWHTSMATAAQFGFILIQAGRGAKFSKADMANAYKLIPVRKEDWWLQGFQWMDRFFMEVNLVMGARSSANLFDSLHELIIRIACANTHFPRCLVAKCLDDVAAAAPASSNKLDDFFSTYISICETVDIPLAEFNSENGKAFLNKTEGVVLGILFDTVTFTWRFPPKKWGKLFWAIHDASVSHELEAGMVTSVVGKILNFAILLPVGKLYRNEILEAFRTAMALPKNTLMATTEGMRAQLRFWLAMVYLSQFGVPLVHKSIHAPANSLHVFTDAAGGQSKSNNGLGGIRAGSEHSPPHSSGLEMAKLGTGRVHTVYVCSGVASGIGDVDSGPGLPTWTPGGLPRGQHSLSTSHSEGVFKERRVVYLYSDGNLYYLHSSVHRSIQQTRP